MIVKLTFKVTPDHDSILPPFTSKLSRSVLALLSPTYKQVMEDSQPFKPIRVTVLKDTQGKPLYAKKDAKVVVKGGEEYFFDFTFTKEEIMKEIIENPSTTVEMWSTKFNVELFDVKAVDSLGIEDSKFYYVRFVTPTMLQPPRPPFKKRKNRYVLFPYVPLLLLSIYQHWLKNVGEVVKGITGLKTLYYLRESAYNLSPVTTFYDGKPVKGFVGWVIYEFEARRGSKLREGVKKLLAYANYFGVGKSRAIGFGEVIVKPANNKNQNV